MGILDRLVLATLLTHYYCTGEGRYVTRKKLTGGGLVTPQNVTIDAKCNINAKCNNF